MMHCRKYRLEECEEIEDKRGYYTSYDTLERVCRICVVCVLRCVFKVLLYIIIMGLDERESLP